MSKVFKNDNLNNLFNDLSETSLEMPNSINIINKSNQHGGSTNDVNNLMSMLTSETDVINSITSTSTEKLENSLKKMLGGKKNKKMVGVNRNDVATSSNMVNMNQDFSATSDDSVFLKSNKMVGGGRSDMATSSAMVNMNQDFSATSDSVFLK